MAVCSSFCSPVGREGVSRQPEGCREGAQHGCVQPKLLTLPKPKKPRALLLVSLSPQRATCQGVSSSAGGGWPGVGRLAVAQGPDSERDLSCLWYGKSRVRAHCRPLPSQAPSLTPRAQAQAVPSSLFSYPVSYVPLNHELMFHGLLRNTDLSCRTASSNLCVICSDYLFPDNTQGPFQTWRGRKHSCLWADSYK